MIYFNDYLDNDSLHPLSSNLNLSQDDENLLEFPSGCIILNREKVAKYIDKLVELPNAGPPNQSIDSFDQYLSEDRFHELAEILIDQEIL